MEQLIDLLLKMPPIVSAIVSMIACAILWFGGQRFLTPIMRELATQSRELKAQSKDLVEIKIQTTRTNGQVISLERTVATHEALDETRHEDVKGDLNEVKGDLLRNRTGIHSLRDQVSEFALRVGLQTRRINKRDDALGVSSKPSASPKPEGDPR